MKKILMLCVVLAIAACAQLTPQNVPLSWSRADVTAYADTNTYLAGVTYRLSNCVVYAATNGIAQSLSNLTIIVRAGDNKTNQLFYGTAAAGTNLFTADFQFPQWQTSPNVGAVKQLGLELTLVDTNGVVVTYNARKLFDVTLPMAGTGTALLLNTIPVTSVFSNALVYFDAVPASCTGFVFRVNGTNTVQEFNK